MSGTRAGGLKAAATNKSRYKADFYQKIGAMGGAKSRGGGFAQNRELAREAGRLGGKVSRRGAIDQLKAQEMQKEKEEALWRERKGL
jgi:general stress protein YciG